MLCKKTIIYGIVIGVTISVLSSKFMNGAVPESSDNKVYLVSAAQSELTVASYRNYYIRASLAGVLANIGPVKAQISTYYQIMGKFPTSKQDLDIAAFDLAEHDHINWAMLTDSGGIKVTLSNELGINKYLVLQPKTSKNGAFIKWRCMTNVDDKYLGIRQHRICEPLVSIK
ncbi:MAG: pilin [Gammaproteobacteria bacterium]|nr:pilin [Gammaproteobacteria bacterium]